MVFETNIQVAIFFWSVHVAALLLTTVLLVYHVRLIQKGSTTFEANRKIGSYNLGWRQNWREVLGDRWYLGNISSAFSKSHLAASAPWSPGILPLECREDQGIVMAANCPLWVSDTI